MGPDVDGVLSRAGYENRIASGWVDGQRLSIQARVAGKRDSEPRGTPYLYVSAGGIDETTQYDSVEDLDEAFERCTEEYGLEES